ncbi:MAG: DUF2971 domain-containing protein [Chitinophagaceae bacterium]|nr:MAG: DUF2971 domain-containing protein [Chitinophagaceae bacterium]
MNHFENLHRIGLKPWTYDRPLYKYSSVKSVLSILNSNAIKFTVPNQLNDPFELSLGLIDCRIETEQDEIDARQWLKELWSNPEHFDVTKDIDINSMTNERIEQMILGSLDKERDELGLLCLSKKYDHNLLWSHYGDSHKGVVLGFEFPLEDNYLGFEVCYETEISPIKIRRGSKYVFDPNVVKWMCTKSKDWEYEAEVRFVSDNQSGFLPFKKSYLTEVYFGMSTNPLDVQLIDKAIWDNGYRNIKKRGFLIQEPRKFGMTTIYQ